MRSFIVKDNHFAGSTYHIPPHRGFGCIKGMVLEEGLFMRYIRVRYFEDIEVTRPAGKPEEPMLFTARLFLSPSAFQWIVPAIPFAGDVDDPPAAFLTSNNTRLSTFIPEGSLTHTLEIFFTKQWLDTQLAGDGTIVRFLEDMLAGGHFLPLPSTAPYADPVAGPNAGLQTGADRLLAAIETELDKPDVSLLDLRARILSLLAGIIRQLSQPVPPAPVRKKTWHVQTIRKVEQRLVQSLEDMLPPQKQLAKEFALSESTLKRHFKAVYGKTLYEYYLEKKMELAKWLLTEKKVSVSETAYMLGYEKVSAFIIIFKKFHKVLPGSLK